MVNSFFLKRPRATISLLLAPLLLLHFFGSAVLELGLQQKNHGLKCCFLKTRKLPVLRKTRVAPFLEAKMFQSNNVQFFPSDRIVTRWLVFLRFVERVATSVVDGFLNRIRCLAEASSVFKRLHQKSWI